MPSYDVVVVGLGAMGSAAASALAARGLRVLGIEQFTPAHDLGSSHGDSRIIRQAYFEHPSYVPLLQEAYRLWEELEVRSGTRLLTLTGGLLLGSPDAGTVTGSRRSAAQWDLPHEMLDAATIRERFGTFAPDDDVVGLYEERAGFVVPEATVTAQLDLARRDGADLRFEERVTGWESTRAGVRVSTEAESYEAGHVVLSPGAWAPRLLDLDVPLRVERQIMHWYTPAGGAERFSAARHPVYVWEEGSGDQVYGFPAREGEGLVKVAFFRRRQLTDPDHVDRVVHPHEIDEMTEWLSHRIPALTRHERAATCLYTVTPDHHFVVGTHPAHANVTVAAGFSGHGFKFTPVIGRIVADLATGVDPGHELGLFDPARSALAASPR